MSPRLQAPFEELVLQRGSIQCRPVLEPDGGYQQQVPRPYFSASAMRTASLVSACGGALIRKTRAGSMPVSPPSRTS